MPAGVMLMHAAATVRHLGKRRACKGRHLIQVSGEEEEGCQARAANGVALRCTHRAGDQWQVRCLVEMLPLCCPARVSAHMLCDRRPHHNLPSHLGGGLGCVAHRIQQVGDLPDTLRLPRHFHNAARIVCMGGANEPGAGRRLESPTWRVAQ